MYVLIRISPNSKVFFIERMTHLISESTRKKHQISKTH